MMDYSSEDFLSISGIQHFVFCRRQWALIHLETQWQDNVRTVDGNIFHDNAHNGTERELRGNTMITRGLPVFSRSLGITGICDVVEFKKSEKGVTLFGTDGKWLPVPVEYKKGQPKENNCDALQLAAQAVCLEEMLACHIEKGYLFYGETCHRTEIVFDDTIREQLKNTVTEMHKYYERMYTPKVKISKRCKACSLSEICMPVLCKDISAKSYISKRVKETEKEPCE